MNILIEKMLQHRGITKEELESFENSDHDLLHSVDDLAAKLKEIHDANKKICVLPDFDMDGIMSGVTGYAGLSVLGFDTELFVPDPQDGYGFGKEQIDRLIEEHPGTQAIITCDTGISCLEGSQYAIDNGIEVLITDHHIENAETSPRELVSVIVDPCAIDETYEHFAICGAFVMWQCLYRYAELYGTDRDVLHIKNLRAFAGVGTISDVMPVLYENRQLIRDAIEIWKGFWQCDKEFIDTLEGTPKAYKDVFRGIYNVCKAFQEEGKIKTRDDLDEDFFGFYLAPTFNSIKRMDGDLSKAFDVFRGNTAAANVRFLMELNAERKKEVTEAMFKIREQDNPYEPYCYVVEDVKPGLLGLIAMKLSDQSGEPCVVVHPSDYGKGFSGSGRSPSWYPFITMTSELGMKFAGHEGAFGCSLSDDGDRLLYEFLTESVAKVKETLPETDSIDADFVIAEDGSGDTQIDQDLFLDFIDELDTLRPFGRGMEPPTIIVEFEPDDGEWRIIGSDQSHLKIHLDAGMDIMCFNQADFIDDGIPEGRRRVIGKLSRNEFRGNISAQFVGNIM